MAQRGKVVRIKETDYERLVDTAILTGAHLQDLLHRAVEEWYETGRVQNRSKTTNKKRSKGTTKKKSSKSKSSKTSKQAIEGIDGITK